MRYIVTIDQSTSGTKALLIDERGAIVAKTSAVHRQSYPRPGWAEHDPEEIYANVRRLLSQLMTESGIGWGQVSALTITNQRETALVWDRRTGKPVYPAIVWQCRRTEDRCRQLREQGAEPLVKSRTGLLLDPYFSATKLAWILEHAPSLPPRSELMAGTIDSWLVWRLTGGAAYVTDHTNASRTSLYNLHTNGWDAELLALFGLEGLELPRIVSSTEVAGYPATTELPGAEHVPICGLIGDSQAALYGQRCRQPGMAKVTYGTGSSMLAYTGRTPLASEGGLVTAVAWSTGEEVHYALEGIIHSSGDTMKWLRDELALFDGFEEAERLASALPGNDGVYLVPAFAGLGAPYWDASARAAIIGLSRGATRAHMIRAGYESIAYQVRDAAELFHREAGIRLAQIRADGGASASGYLMQLQADTLQAELACAGVAELSAMGSCYLGGLATGVWADEAELDRLASDATTYRPLRSEADANADYAGWLAAVDRVRSERRSPAEQSPIV